jgi:hypothetical protein
VVFSFATDGFELHEALLDRGELDEVRALVARRDAPPFEAYPRSIAVHFDPVTRADFVESPPLAKVLRALERVAGGAYDPFYAGLLDLRAETLEDKPGLGWHQDAPVFGVLEAGTRAAFAWFILESTLDDPGGGLELVPRARAAELFGVDVSAGRDAIVEVAKSSIPFRTDKRLALVDYWTLRPKAFVDSLDEVAVRPRYEAGDVVICDKDIFARP